VCSWGSTTERPCPAGTRRRHCRCCACTQRGSTRREPAPRRPSWRTSPSQPAAKLAAELRSPSSQRTSASRTAARLTAELRLPSPTSIHRRGFPPRAASGDALTAIFSPLSVRLAAAPLAACSRRQHLLLACAGIGGGGARVHALPARTGRRGGGCGTQESLASGEHCHLWRERSVILLAGIARHEDSESVGR
jgi:hypothetical protein